MPIEFQNRAEKGKPLTLQELDAILDLIKDFANALEALMSVSLNSDGTLRYPGFYRGASSNNTDSYTATVAGLATQADLLGQILVLKVDVANSGPASLDVNGYGSAPIVRFQDMPLESDTIKPGQYLILTWNGTNYVLHSQAGVVPPANYAALDPTGTGDALVVNPRVGAVEIPETLYTGYLIRVKILAANAGAVTIKLGTLPVVPIKRINGQALLAGDLSAGQVVDLIYDGVNFQAPQLRTAKSFVQLGDSLAGYVAGADVSYSHLLGTSPHFFQVCVICTVAEKGYAVDDFIDVSSIQIDDSGSPERTAFSPYANFTKVGVVINNYGGTKQFGVRRKDAPIGDPVQLTPANWQLQFRAIVV